jgi:ribose-phosphate pyrophosphokinase
VANGHRATTRAPLIFGLDDPHGMAAQVAACVDGELAALELRDFPGGEFKVRPLVDPQHRATAIVAGLYGDSRRTPQDRLVMLLFLIGALRDHGATSISVIAPWLPFARKDRRTQLLDPTSFRYVAQLIEAAGANRLISLEPHNDAAFDNAWRISAARVPAHRVLLAAALDAVGTAPLVVASPDPGGVRRAQLWREAIAMRSGRQIGFAMLDKRRHANELEGGFTVCGEVRDATVLLVDDLIASGETLARAGRAIQCAGAARVMVAAAHGQFLERAADLLDAAGFDALLITDSLPSARLAGHRLRERLTVVSAAPHLASLLGDQNGGAAEPLVTHAIAAPG